MRRTGGGAARLGGVALLTLVLHAAVAIAAPGDAGDPLLPPVDDPDGTLLESKLVLRYRGMELRPDLKLYTDYEVDLASGDNAFHVSRAYIGFKVKLLSWLGGRVTLDVTEVDDVEGELKGSRVARLKYAHIDVGIPWISSHVSFGIVHTPYVYWIEHIEGTRFVRKVMAEQEYGYPSADLGAVLVGHFRSYVSWAVGAFNGEGYHGLEDARFKDIAGRVSLRPTPELRGLEGLQLTGYFQLEVAEDDGEATDRRFGGALTYRLADAIVSADARQVRGDRLALWLQVFGGQRGLPDSLADNLGLSAGVRLELPASCFAIVRVDRFDPDLDRPDDHYWRTLAVAGWRPHHGVKLALTFQGTTPARGTRGEQLLGVHGELHL